MRKGVQFIAVKNSSSVSLRPRGIELLY